MNVNKIVENQRRYFNSNRTKDLSFRKAMLKKLLQAIKENEAEIYESLKLDLNKSVMESYLTEFQMVIAEINLALTSLDEWAKPRRKPTPVFLLPASSYTVKEPYGVVLVLSPWNYPFQLALSPLVGAIAAGNCVLLKTSKSSEHTSAIISKIINQTFKPYYVHALPAACDYDELLSQKYDYIFFTGSERVGKLVMRAASEYLTPVSLELGGKSPCIVDKHVDLKLAAKRIIWGKTLNAGQTCVAPDYVLVDEAVKKPLIREMITQISLLWNSPLENEDYPKIINSFHFQRLLGLIEREPEKLGGNSNSSMLKIEPTLFTNTSFSSEIMKEEIFGPIIPILSYSDIDAAIKELKSRPKPLACYIFSEDTEFSDKLLNELSFGGGCINDVIMHLANDHLPFGGVGSSGMGNYHGSYSFSTFSHEKGYLKNNLTVDFPFRYPPYKKTNLNFIKTILRS